MASDYKSLQNLVARSEHIYHSVKVGSEDWSWAGSLLPPINLINNAKQVLDKNKVGLDISWLATPSLLQVAGS